MKNVFVSLTFLLMSLLQIPAFADDVPKAKNPTDIDWIIRGGGDTTTKRNEIPLWLDATVYGNELIFNFGMDRGIAFIIVTYPDGSAVAASFYTADGTFIMELENVIEGEYMVNLSTAAGDSFDGLFYLE